MRNLLLFIVSIVNVYSTLGQSLIGAWEWTETTHDGQKVRGVVIFTESYQPEPDLKNG